VFALPLDAALNLIWLGISVGAIVWFGRRDWRRCFTVFLATVALFPIVSDSDDLFSFSFLRIPQAHHRSAGSTPENSREQDTVQLARVLESLDHWQIAASYDVAPTECCLALLVCLTCAVGTRPVLARCGRSPPLA